MNWIRAKWVVAGALLAVSAGVAQKQSSPAPQDKNLMNSLKGPELFGAYCATCHGKDAKGKGPMASSLKVPPADLTGIAKRNGGTFPFLKVQKIISGEEAAPGAHGTREMPVWGPIMSEVTWDQDLGRVRTYVLAKYLEEVQAK